MLLPPYDASGPLLPGAPPTPLPLAHWDGAHFASLAVGISSGQPYPWEQSFAFYPGLPLLLAGMRRLVSPLEAVLGWAPLQTVVACGAALSLVCHVAAGATLHALTLEVFQGRGGGDQLPVSPGWLARVAADLFILSPGGVFFSAVYTEAPFALASFVGMLCMVRAAQPGVGWWLRWVGGGAFAVAASLRSNGALLAGFAIVQAVLEWGGRPRLTRTAAAAAVLSLTTTALLVLILLPPTLFRIFSEAQFCGPLVGWKAGVAAVFRLPTHAWPAEAPPAPRPWCGSLGGVYTYVQSVHWGVGLGRYWQLAHVPHFLLASPVLALAVAGGAWAAPRLPPWVEGVGRSLSRGTPPPTSSCPWWGTGSRSVPSARWRSTCR